MTSTGGPASRSHQLQQAVEIKEDQVMYHFYRNGKSRKDYRKPSTKFMVSLFNELQKRGKLHTGANKSDLTDVIRSFSGKNSVSKKSSKNLTEFYIPYLPPHERLKMAEIRFLRDPKTKCKLHPMKIRINVKKSNKVMKKVVLRARPLEQKEYDVIDVTDFVGPWVNSFHGNISLGIRIVDQSRGRIKSHGAAQSLIVLYLQDGEFLTNMYSSFTDSAETLAHVSRQRRSASAKHNSTDGESIPKSRIRRERVSRKWNRTGKKENCQLNNFEVNFNTIGWGQWIIHPKKFNARFCFGVCPSPIDVKYKPTNHAMLRALMLLKKPNSAPAPCCVPTKLNPLSMMYFEYNEVVVRHHEDMIAEECGCR
ncbi:hypothetical protein Btru_015065 [Bulinus truncatus]|nr:hypothetical protein Btru_015065 [Bulinus truncatus]